MPHPPTPTSAPRFVAPVLSGPAPNPVNTTMIAVALVPIAQATGVSASLAIWLVTGLYIVSAVAQPAMGRIADIFGPKKVYVTGLLLVMVGGLVPAVWAFFPRGPSLPHHHRAGYLGRLSVGDDTHQ
nr:MFS transporter [Corynebacterium variabile]